MSTYYNYKRRGSYTYADIEKRLDKIEKKLYFIEKKIDEIAKMISEKEEAERKQKQQKGKATAVDIIQREGVVFESDLKRIRNADAFFANLRKHGVLIFEGSKMRAAVTKDYLDLLLGKLSSLEGPAEADRILSKNDEKLYRLYRFLRENGFLTYDKRKGWIIIEKQH